MVVLEKEDHLLNTKLVIKSVGKFSNEQAEKMFMNTTVHSEKDITELLNYIQECRPRLFRKLNSEARSLLLKKPL